MSTEITAEKVRQQMKRGEAIFFVEVRREAAHDYGVMKVRGALRLTDAEVPHRLDRIPHERRVVVYSTAADDQPAFEAARLVQESGHPQVEVLVGGLKACLTAGLPFEEVDRAKEMARLRGA